MQSSRITKKLQRALRPSFDDSPDTLTLRSRNMQQQYREQEALKALEQGPIVCPMCWDHVIERIEGVTLSANNMGGRVVMGALIYHCSQWHIFAVFQQYSPDVLIA